MPKSRLRLVRLLHKLSNNSTARRGVLARIISQRLSCKPLREEVFAAVIGDTSRVAAILELGSPPTASDKVLVIARGPLRKERLVRGIFECLSKYMRLEFENWPAVAFTSLRINCRALCVAYDFHESSERHQRA